MNSNEVDMGGRGSKKERRKAMGTGEKKRRDGRKDENKEGKHGRRNNVVQDQ